MKVFLELFLFFWLEFEGWCGWNQCGDVEERDFDDVHVFFFEIFFSILFYFKMFNVLFIFILNFVFKLLILN